MLYETYRTIYRAIHRMSWRPSEQFYNQGYKENTTLRQVGRKEKWSSQNLQDWCVCVCVCVLSGFSCVQDHMTLWTADCQVSLSIGFSRQEYWSGLPCPPPGDLPNLGIELASVTSPALAGMFFTTRTTWEVPSLVGHPKEEGVSQT